MLPVCAGLPTMIMPNELDDLDEPDLRQPVVDVDAVVGVK